MPVTDTFDEACAGLSEFLRQENQPAELLWLFREDVTGRRRRFFIRPSSPDVNRSLYRQLYQFGARQGRGVRLVVAFFLGHRACCYVWVPRDGIDASYAMMSDGLHFVITANPPEFPTIARQCRTLPGFLLRRAWSRFRGEAPGLQELPRSSEIHAHTNP